ncbi:MAG TPA: hypothetical protein VFZ18_11845, partial [Longimicrobiaceae bacterium]
TPGPPPAGDGFQARVSERWLYGRQRAEFTPWSQPDHWNFLYVDSVTPGALAGERELRISSFEPNGARYARVRHDGAGRIMRVEGHLPTPARPPGTEFTEALLRLPGGPRLDTGPDPAFGTPEVDAAELILPFHPENLRPGAVWTDSLRLAGPRRTVRGIRHSRLERDTLIGGRRHWVVRDSATVRWEEEWMERERTLDTLVVAQRVADGVIVGSQLYDPDVGLFLSRSDSTRLSGEAVLRYPDGREFRTPASYERTREWRRFDREGVEARRAELLAEMRAERGGMVRYPRSPLERRLRDGDPALVDSLVLEWHRSRDAENRARLVQLVESYVARGDDRSALIGLALEAGDTVFALQRVLRGRPEPARPLEVRDLELLLPLLADPGLALDFGLARDPFYEFIRGALVDAPPVLAPHPGLWPCTPEACRLLAAQIDTPGDPRLRDLALIARLLMDPARHADEVARRADEGSALVRPAVHLLAGVGATWPAAAQAPLPPPAADWREWLRWMAGVNPALPPPPPDFPSNPIRFDRRHATAMRFVEAYTGRPVVEEVRQRYADAAEDSARLVFGTILVGLGERWSTATDLAEALRTGSDAERTLALRELPRLFAAAPPAEPEVAQELVNRLLQVVLEGADPWPELRPGADPRRRVPRRVVGGDLPIFLLADSLPATLRAAWSDRATVISAADWSARSERLPAMLFRAGTVLRYGPFVQLRLNYEGRSARGENEAPAGYAGGFTVTLLESPAGWVQISGSQWIT